MGDGTAISNAGILYPIGLSVDSMSNIFIVDQKYHAIRKIDFALGKIITVAGVDGFSIFIEYLKSR